MRAQIAERKAEILALLRRRSSPNQIAAPPIRPRAPGEPAPLSFAQERLWFLEQLEPDSTAYNICRASRLLGNLSSPLLEASLNEIINRHETLRTAFRLIDGKPVQIVPPAKGLSIDFVDLSSVQKSERTANIQRKIQAEALRPFDLESGLLLRCALLRVGEQEHIVVFTTHHSAADAWSMGILTRELWTLYDAFLNGRPCPLEPLPVQYSDYAVWEREWLQGDVLESQLGYWRERLKDLSVLNLPTDRPRKPRQSFHGARLAIELPDQLTSAMKEMSHRFAVTPFMILLAAFQVLLYRYTGQEDVVVGSPIANRRRPEVEGLIGFFVNTLVLRADLSGKPSFTELLFHVRDVCVGANANQDLPFEKLVQELQPERDQSRNPLFQVMFVLQNATRPFSGIPGLRAEPLEVATNRSPFDLSLFLRERNGKYLGNIEYSTDLFDQDRIERMAGHFRILLEAIVKDPEQPIATLPILTEAERHRILFEWNDTAADYPNDRCIHQLFEEQVERTPEAIAVEFENQQITYRELNRRANQLAHHLISLGIGPEKLVGICLHRSIEMVVGLLGTLKAGGAYVPLDPAYPRKRLQFMLDDAQCSVLVTQEDLGESIDFQSILRSQAKMVCLNRDHPVITQQSGDKARSAVLAENLAYVIYTSGSTGTPKGVAIEHRNTANLLQWARTVYKPEELAAVLVSTSICFDLSVFEIFVPLCWGGKLIIVENALCLLESSPAKEATLLNTVPSAMATLLSSRSLPGSLRTVNFAGEPLQPELVRRIYDLGTVKKVYDLYGPSETTTYSTFALRTVSSPETIGRPIANTCVYLLDSHMQPVTIGVPGELFIGGAGIVRGYLHRPELTAAKFISDPFTKNTSARIYRTGDIARYLPDGNIEFLGRIDNQVKVRGYRIELAEIEAALNQHPAIKESVVVARDRASSGEKELIGYFVQKGPSPLTIESVRNLLREKLPDYMVPSVFVELNALPQTPNGKIDRTELRSRDVRKQALKTTRLEPRTEVEEVVAQIWRDVLKVEPMGIYDNFFELGGHSLLAIQIISHVRETFDKDVPLSALFDAPTVAGMAATIEKTINDLSHELPPIVRIPHDGPVPLSKNQEHLWRLDQMVPGTHFFNIPYIYRLSGTLNVEALEQAVREVVCRHDSVRTVFDVICGKPMQVVYEMMDFHLACHDLRSTQPSLISGRAATVIVQEREYPFQLGTWPLFRVALVQLTETESLLLITMHHIVSDYWSMQIFSQELALIYEYLVCGKPLTFTQPALQFADYVEWERRMLATGSFDKELAFWRRQLAPPLSTIRFGQGSEASTKMNFLTSRRSFELDEHLVAAVKAFANVEKCTTSMVFLAALNILLFSQTEQTDIRIGLLTANRGDFHAAATMGHFMNTLIIRTRLAPDMTFSELLYQVRASALAAHAHQHLPFEYLANVLQEQDGIERAALFQVLLMYRYSTAQPYELPGVRLAPIVIREPNTDSEVMMTTYDLVLDVRETSTKLTGSVNFSLRSHYEIANSFAEQLSVLLNQAIAGESKKKIGTIADLVLRNTGYPMPQIQ